MSGLFSKETRRQIRIRPGELRVVLWAGAFFFCILAGYSVLRPVREQMGIRGGVRNLPYLFLATWTVMLVLQPAYGWVVARLPRRHFVAIVYHFFSATLAVFFAAMVFGGEHAQIQIGRAFFVWVSVLNLWVVSVFWSVLVDSFASDRAKRLYAWIAVGGTLGSIFGALVAWGGLALVGWIAGDEAAAESAVPYLLLICVLFFQLTILCSRRLLKLFAAQGYAASRVGADADRLIGGTPWAGLVAAMRSPYLRRICLYLLCYTVTGTLLYFVQAEIIADVFASPAQRTQAFAVIDLVTQVLTLIVQVFLTRRILASQGLGRTLAILPVLAGLAFVVLAAWPVFWVLVVTQALRRAARYAITKPSREVLFSVVSREEKYKAKGAIDTFVYRSGDVLGAGVRGLLGWLAPGFLAVAAVAVPVSAAWAFLALRLGREHGNRARSDHPEGDGDRASGYIPASPLEGPPSETPRRDE